MVKRRINTIAYRLAYAERWLVLSLIIGLITGIAAYMFYELLHYTEGFTLWVLGVTEECCKPPEGLASKLIQEEARIYLIPLTLIIGAIISSILVYKFSPEAEGHGTDAALVAFHRRAAMIEFKVPLIKGLASSATIGFGGSGGVEGPSAQMGAGIGSTLARVLKLSLESRRIMLVSGMAASLSALFQSPLGTALFATEVLYKRDLETQAIIPAILSSIVAYAITAPLFDFKPVLPTLRADPATLYNPLGLASIVLMSLIIAPLALLHVTLFYRVKEGMDKLVSKGLPVYFKPVLGALGAGLIALFIPHVLGSGRDVLSIILEGGIDDASWKLLGLPLSVSLLLIAIAKMAATALSIGSGGSGGVFAPSLLIGALIGACYGIEVAARVTGLDPSIYAYIGMAAFFGAAAKVPFSVSVLIGEMGRNYLLIPPTLLASVVAREIAGDLSIYASQLRTRLRAEMLGAEYLYELLKSRRLVYRVTAREIANKRLRPARLDDQLIEALERMLTHKTKAIAVVDDSNRVVGAIEERDLDVLLAIAQERPEIKVENVKIKHPPIVNALSSIEEVLEEIINHGSEYVVVVENGLYHGLITVDDVLLVLAHIIHEHFEEIRKGR